MKTLHMPYILNVVLSPLASYLNYIMYTTSTNELVFTKYIVGINFILFKNNHQPNYIKRCHIYTLILVGLPNGHLTIQTQYQLRQFKTHARHSTNTIFTQNPQSPT